MLGASNGTYRGAQIFDCPDLKAVFVPFNQFALDERFSNGERDEVQDFGGMDCPIVPGYHNPIKVTDIRQVCGQSKGIQGHQNSCYLDATLFAMFSFTR